MTDAKGANKTTSTDATETDTELLQKTKKPLDSKQNGKLHPTETYEECLTLQISWFFSIYHYKYDRKLCQHRSVKLYPGDHDLTNFFSNTFGLRTHQTCESCAYGYFGEFLNDNLELWKFADLQASFVIHGNTRKFMYRYSDIWFWIVKRCIYSMDAAIDTKGLDVEQLLVYQDLAIITTNIGFLTERHWKIITFKCSFITKLFDFINNMVLHCKQERMICTPTLFPILTIMWKWLNYFQNYKLKHASKRSVLLMDEELNRYRKKFESMLSQSEKNGEVTFLIRGLYESVDKYRNYNPLIDKKFLEVCKIKRANQKCQCFECNVMRMDKPDWLKCSQCLTAVYCSRKCAKYDWKYGNHKNYCFAYFDMRMHATRIPKRFFMEYQNAKNGTKYPV